jgi:hypothetical protein
MREGERKGKFGTCCWERRRPRLRARVQINGGTAGPLEFEVTWNTTGRRGRLRSQQQVPLGHISLYGVGATPTTGLSLMEAPSLLVLKRIRGTLEDTEFDV